MMKRYSVTLSEKANEDLLLIASSIGEGGNTSLAIRRSAALLAFMIKEHAAGSRLYFKTEDGEEIQLMVLL
jgi:hypothetical protein